MGSSRRGQGAQAAPLLEGIPQHVQENEISMLVRMMCAE
jgi:hypothetical protein